MGVATEKSNHVRWMRALEGRWGTEGVERAKKRLTGERVLDQAFFLRPGVRSIGGRGYHPLGGGGNRGQKISQKTGHRP